MALNYVLYSPPSWLALLLTRVHVRMSVGNGFIKRHLRSIPSLLEGKNEEG